MDQTVGVRHQKVSLSSLCERDSTSGWWTFMFRTWELKLKKNSRDRGVGLLQQYSKHEDILKIGARNTMRQYILKKVIKH